MAIDEHYIPAFSIETVILDKDTGAPLAGGIVTFEESLQPGTLKPVYQITGTSPNFSYTQLPNPMTLSSIGTFEDSLGNPVVPYFFPYDASFNPEYYRVVVESSGSVPQFVRDPVPYIPDAGGSTTTSSAYENEISNPQFSEVLFDTTSSSYTFNFNAVSQQAVEIAPDWSIVVTSPAAGTVTVSQVTPTGALNLVTNPGTLLNITSAGISRLRLRQRIYGSPNLWGSQYLSCYFVAKTYAGTSSDLILYYSQSDGTVTDVELKSATLTGDGAYTAFFGSKLIPASTSTQTAPDAYIDIEFDLPTSTEIDITSVMLAATGATSVDNIGYDQESENRQVDHLFHYYKPLLEYKPIPSYLVGWDFPLNPAQPLGASVSAFATGVNTSNYVWDQTIAFQSVDSALTFSRSSTTNGLVTTAAIASQFAIIQYIPMEQAREILSQRNAIALKGKISTETITGYVNLYWTTDASLPDLKTATFHSLVSALTAGVPTVGNGTWNKVSRDTLGDATFSLTTTNSEFEFSQWDATATDGKTTATFAAIVISFNELALASAVTLDYCSLVGGDIATRPAPQAISETLSNCQYYYQKSFLTATVPANSVSVAAEVANQVVGAGTNGNGPAVRFAIPMRATPTVILYNPGAANSQIRNTSAPSDWSGSAASNVSAKGFIATGTSPGGSAAGQTCSVHWAADSRLGIV